MHLRAAQPLDHYAMGSIMGECNKIDTLTRYFVKDMDKYPTTYRKSGVGFIRRRAAIPGTVSFVVETESSDYDASEKYRAPEVVGFITYRRTGTSAKALKWTVINTSSSDRFNGFLDGLEDRYLRVFPSVHCTYRNDLFQNVLPFLNIPFDQEIFAEAWEIDLFFVHPRWQRKGIGKKLLQWGFDIATEEAVPVVVKSSSLGAMAYRACGFMSLGEIGLDELFDTKEFGGEEPQYWCWEPKACKGQWFERGKEALEDLMKQKEKVSHVAYTIV